MDERKHGFTKRVVEIIILDPEKQIPSAIFCHEEGGANDADTAGGSPSEAGRDYFTD